VSKLASPSGFPKARLSLSRVGRATARRQALHVIRLYEQRTELRCPMKGSVPLAGSLPSPSTSPFGSVNRRQVLRELRGLLCQSSRLQVGRISKSDAFTQIFCHLSTRFFASRSVINEKRASFPQNLEGPKFPLTPFCWEGQHDLAVDQVE
jgi:hypothetical protein